MTEIARFAENSLFCPFAPFFGETQTSQKGRKKGDKMEKYGRQFLRDLNLSDAIEINQNQSELIGTNRINSDKLG